MCSPVQFDIIRHLENMLICDSPNSLCLGGIKDYKVSRDQKVADYICYASNRQCALEASEIWKSKCIEKTPWLKDFIQVTVAPHGFNISLSRKLCFQAGLQDVEIAGVNYGHSNLFSNKVFQISIVETKDSACLTSLRINLLNQVINKVIEACGGSLDGSEPNVKLEISNKSKVSEGSINLSVGPVICHTSDKTSIIKSDVYKRLRMEDISQMCEHKLSLNEEVTPEDKTKLLNTTILFDLFQKSVWKSITLRFTEERKDEKSSCKDALFVLYNYARLLALFAKYDDRALSGMYPPLPTLSEVDFSLLTREEEWQIMFHTILNWPSVLRNSILDLESGKPKIHLLFCFLKTTAINFSHYYHRTRILTEPRSHLLPVLFARMHLLKALLTVIDNAFKLVCISPLNYM